MKLHLLIRVECVHATWALFGQRPEQVSINDVQEIGLPPMTFPGFTTCKLEFGTVVVVQQYFGVFYKGTTPTSLNLSGEKKILFRPPAGYTYLSISEVQHQAEPTIEEAQAFARWVLNQPQQK
jgi:hypothetical protein